MGKRRKTMNDIQIIGLVMATVCIICGTAIVITAIVTKRKNQFQADQAERDRKQTAWNNTFESESLALYEQERQARIASETREGIAKALLVKERKETDRLKKLVAVLEGRC